MPANAFDKASRRAAKVDPAAFFAWVTGLPADRLEFRGWLDTRAVPLPHEPDQIGDTVARIEDPAGTRVPWAVAVEFQAEPDPLMFGRLLVYLGYLWQSIKPDPEPGSRFSPGAIVVNLTGTGRASLGAQWPEAGFGTQLQVLERNLASENADDLLTGVESGRWSRAILPWLPLMTGGDDPGIIDRWKALADGEPDVRVKQDYGGLALIFAGAAKRKPIWQKALEGWNVIESDVVKEWQAEARIAQAAVSVIAVLEARFGKIGPETEAKIRGCGDLEKLQAWVPQAANAPSLDAFRAAAGL